MLWHLVRDQAEHVTNCRSEQEQVGNDDNSHQNKDQCILDQTLPSFGWNDETSITDFVTVGNRTCVPVRAIASKPVAASDAKQSLPTKWEIASP